MSTDGALRQLEGATQLAHGELVPGEQQQQPASRGVGKGRQAVEDWARLNHPYIRMKGSIVTPACQGVIWALNVGGRSARPVRGARRGPRRAPARRWSAAAVNKTVSWRGERVDYTPSRGGPAPPPNAPPPPGAPLEPEPTQGALARARPHASHPPG